MTATITQSRKQTNKWTCGKIATRPWKFSHTDFPHILFLPGQSQESKRGSKCKKLISTLEKGFKLDHDIVGENLCWSITHARWFWRPSPLLLCVVSNSSTRGRRSTWLHRTMKWDFRSVLMPWDDFVNSYLEIKLKITNLINSNDRLSASVFHPRNLINLLKRYFHLMKLQTHFGDEWQHLQYAIKKIRIKGLQLSLQSIKSLLLIFAPHDARPHLLGK